MSYYDKRNRFNLNPIKTMKKIDDQLFSVSLMKKELNNKRGNQLSIKFIVDDCFTTKVET